MKGIKKLLEVIDLVIIGMIFTFIVMPIMLIAGLFGCFKDD